MKAADSPAGLGCCWGAAGEGPGAKTVLLKT